MRWHIVQLTDRHGNPLAGGKNTRRPKEGQTARKCAVLGCDQGDDLQGQQAVRVAVSTDEILAAVFLLGGSKGGIVCGCYRAVPPIFGCARLRCSWKVNSHNVPPISLVLFSLRRSLRLNSGPNKLYQES